MATIDSPRIIYNLLKNNGHCEDDPLPHTIWKYYNPSAQKICWAVFYTGSIINNHYQMASSPAVDLLSIELLWVKHLGIIHNGKMELKRLEKELHIMDTS
jgi:hypothetical protein